MKNVQLIIRVHKLLWWGAVRWGRFQQKKSLRLNQNHGTFIKLYKDTILKQEMCIRS